MISPSERLERVALCSMTCKGTDLYNACPSSACYQTGLPVDVPLTFTSPQHYVSVFEPLIHQEAKAGISNSFWESSTAGRGWLADLVECRHASTGWVHLCLKPTSSWEQGDLGTVEGVREGSIVVLERQGPAATAQHHKGLELLEEDWDSSCSEGEIRPDPHPYPQGPAPPSSSPPDPLEPLRFTGVARKATWGGANDVLHVDLFPACPQHQQTYLETLTTSTGDESCPPLPFSVPQVGCLSGLSSLITSPPSQWWVIAIGPLITEQREVEALSRITLNTSPSLPSSSSSSSSPGCTRGLSSRLLKAILHPDQAADKAAEGLLRQWPKDAIGRSQDKPFLDYLKSTYDTPQMQAIESCASHLCLPSTSTPLYSTVGPPPPSGNVSLPITLIQGPPGTGKTHTVLGILNTWHLVQYSRHQEGWRSEAERALASIAAATSANPGKQKSTPLLPQKQSNGGGNFDVIFDAAHEAHRLLKKNQALDGLMNLQPPSWAPKPRVLVCAPSNAAIDELLGRVIKEGFRDLNGNKYSPPVVRVGSETSPLSPEVGKVWTEAQAERYLSMSLEEWRGFSSNSYNNLAAMQASIEIVMQKASAVAQNGTSGILGGARGAGGGAGSSLNLSSASKSLSELAAELVEVFDRREKIRAEIERLELVKFKFSSGSNRSDQRAFKHPKREGTAGGGRIRVSLTPQERDVKDEIEVSLVDGAELVFTTLSSTGRKILSSLKRGFDAVLIDEACQCTEVACLQPLIFGADKLVLVGDPQQLPATLFSTQTRGSGLDRSLFERLQQAGLPCILLSMQYRMHPQIRTFPSDYFYQGRLADGVSVLRAPPAAFYQSPSGLLQPYRVFDVEGGRENGGKSKSNQQEADLAVALFWELRNSLAIESQRRQQLGQPPVERTEVGIVTPYRSQRDLIRATFDRLLGARISSEVKIETVDSFQGKQLDVIILSCVRTRASGREGDFASSSIGFLADVRRMNVAITRAKRALWILCRASALSGADPAWRSLISDASGRGCVVRRADPRALFPSFVRLEEDRRRHEESLRQAPAHD